MEEKLILRNVVEGCDEYEIDLSKRIYMFSSLREYRLCDFVMDKLDKIRRSTSRLFIDDPKEGEDLDYLGNSEFTYINGDDIITLNKDGRSIKRNNEDLSYYFNGTDLKVSGSYKVDYFGKGNVMVSYLDWDGSAGGDIKNSYLYLSNIESMKSPYEQMDQMDVIFKIIINNPNCKVFFSTVSPYVVNYFNVNLLRYYEELGDRFSYYQFNDEMDEKTGRINIWKLNAVCNKSGRKFADTMDHSDIMELIIDEYFRERELYNKRNNIEQK
jgi:hypothetical protein